jgi:hypothetical protein
MIAVPGGKKNGVAPADSSPARPRYRRKVKLVPTLVVERDAAKMTLRLPQPCLEGAAGAWVDGVAWLEGAT